MNKLELDFPALPYLIDGNIRLTDTYAIMLYLATKYAPELSGQTPKYAAEIDMVYYQIRDAKQFMTQSCYWGAEKKVLAEEARAKMKPILAFLGKKDFLMGRELSFLDFYMLETC